MTDRVSSMKQGDTAPALVITCLDDTTPVNLSAAGTVKILGKKGGLPLFSRTVTGDASGQVTLVWEAADTLSVGSINIEVEVTWPDAKVQTFPADGYLRVEVRADLG